MNPNSEFRIVFQPKYPEQHRNRRRFAIGAKSLHKYIGLENANTALIKALKSKKDIEIVKFRTHGSITFYSK